MALEEKKIPYRVEKINMRCYGEKPPSFARLQPSGAIPVAIIDGTVYNQSNDIIYVLEELFPDSKRLLPPPSDNEKRIKAQSLLRLEQTITMKPISRPFKQVKQRMSMLSYRGQFLFIAQYLILTKYLN